jgi:hypothetical protein
MRLLRQGNGGQRQALPIERTSDDFEFFAELSEDVVYDPVVGSCRGTEDRNASRKQLQDPGDAPIIRPKVVTPVADAVCFVDHEQSDILDELRKHVATESDVVETLRRDEQDIDPAGLNAGFDPFPIVGVLAVDCLGVHAGSLGHEQLVAHQRQEWRDQNGGTGSALAKKTSSDEVDRALSPTSSLNNENPSALLDQPFDRFPLTRPERRARVRGQAAE